MAIVNARAYAAGEVDASALGVVAEDDHTLVIRLEKSNPDFPSLTAGAHYMPCNQDYFQSCQGITASPQSISSPMALSPLPVPTPGRRTAESVRSL